MSNELGRTLLAAAPDLPEPPDRMGGIARKVRRARTRAALVGTAATVTVGLAAGSVVLSAVQAPVVAPLVGPGAPTGADDPPGSRRAELFDFPDNASSGTHTVATLELTLGGPVFLVVEPESGDSGEVTVRGTAGLLYSKAFGPRSAGTLDAVVLTDGVPVTAELTCTKPRQGSDRCRVVFQIIPVRKAQPDDSASCPPQQGQVIPLPSNWPTSVPGATCVDRPSSGRISTRQGVDTTG